MPSNITFSFKKLFALVLVCGCVFLGSPATGQHAAAKRYDSLATGILVLINQHRKSIRRTPLVLDTLVARIAERHSRNMANGKFPFGHDGFSERMSFLSKKLGNVDGFAENVAEGPTTAAEAVDLWLKSPGHKQNIEGNYNLTGIGIAESADGLLYFTQIFLRKNK